MPDEIIRGALDRFRESQDATDLNRMEAEEDFRFARLAEQWDAEMIRQRMAENRPALTINRLPAFIRQVVNEARQSKPGIKVSPVDGGADEDTAEVIGGLVRSIERHSNADDAYDTAIDHAVTGGFGFFRLSIDYAHPQSFDMAAYIERIAAPWMVHWDPTSTKPDASDWQYAFVSEWMSQALFKARFPKASPIDFETDSDDVLRDWQDIDQVRVAEYWLRERATRKLLQVRNRMNGDVLAVTEDDYEGYLDRIGQEMQARGVGIDPGALFEVIRERDAEHWKVKRRLISGADVLEEDDWPGSTIPICPVWGDEVIVDGRRHFRSLIRDARDPQRMFNFWRSATTELVALAPRAPWMVHEDGLPTDEVELAKWYSANMRSHAFLTYSGQQMPQRQNFAGVPAGAIQEALNAADDMKAITGIHDPSLGARSNETSGRAILARQRESDVSNYHFQDNLNRAIRYAGQCLVEIIPAIYGPRQTIRILGEDMAEKVVHLTQQGQGGQPGINGQPRLYDISTGRYDVTVRAGPSYQTQRDEAREVLIEMIRARPELAPIVGDVLLDNMDFNGADKIAERLRLMLPPQVQQAEGIGNPVQGMPGQMMPGQPPQPMQPLPGPQAPQQVPSQPLPANAPAMQGQMVRRGP